MSCVYTFFCVFLFGDVNILTIFAGVDFTVAESPVVEAICFCLVF